MTFGHAILALTVIAVALGVVFGFDASRRRPDGTRPLAVWWAVVFSLAPLSFLLGATNVWDVAIPAGDVWKYVLTLAILALVVLVEAYRVFTKK